LGVPLVAPFSGLTFDPDRVGPLDLVTSPPYDTIAPDQERQLHASSPHNVVHLILGRDQPGDDETQNKYTRAARTLRAWRDERVLVGTDGPSWYAYEMAFTYAGRQRRVRGLLCEVELEEWGGSIVPHERTMPAPVKDRMSLLREVRANLSPVYALYRGPHAELAALLEETATKDTPFGVVTDESGVEHRMWILRDTDGASIPTWLADEELLIADGHHRYTVALAYRDERRAQDGPGPWDRMFMFLVDAGTEDPPVLPIHRVLLAGSPPTAGVLVRDLAEVLSDVDDDELTYGSVTMDNGHPIHRVAQLDAAPPTVCALHEQLLPEDAELLFVPDAVVAEEAVRTGEAPAAFFLPPTRVERIRAVIEGGRRLPQKSTFFWPKPRTGFVIRPLD
jgi:uncharacterized protein (DUF1015 family)